MYTKCNTIQHEIRYNVKYDTKGNTIQRVTPYNKQFDTMCNTLQGDIIMDQITIKAPAKINLGLDVVRRKENGYHEVKMIMQTVDICDELTFYKSEQSGITIQVDVADIPNDKDNLIYKAAELLLAQGGIEEGVLISLKKIIPVAAGMAGGSADAAATFIGINKLFELGKTKEELMKMAVSLGADIPYCIMGGTALAEGIGEILTPMKTPPSCYIVVAKPDIYVSTQYVYENLNANTLKTHPDIDRLIREMEREDLVEMSKLMENVLESVTIKSHPIIEEIKDIMKREGALNAIMSGSGPSVFGIYDKKELAIKTFELLKSDNKIKQIFLTTFKGGNNYD